MYLSLSATMMLGFTVLYPTQAGGRCVSKDTLIRDFIVSRNITQRHWEQNP